MGMTGALRERYTMDIDLFDWKVKWSILMGYLFIAQGTQNQFLSTHYLEWLTSYLFIFCLLYTLINIELIIELRQNIKLTIEPSIFFVVF